jgi:hypothetical protein
VSGIFLYIRYLDILGMLADRGILGSKTRAGSGIAAEFDRGPLLALRATNLHLTIDKISI